MTTPPTNPEATGMMRYKVVQNNGEYCLKGCLDGDLVDYSAFAAQAREIEALREALRSVRDGLICTRQAPHQYDANHYCANCGTDLARHKDAIDAALGAGHE